MRLVGQLSNPTPAVQDVLDVQLAAADKSDGTI
jgi:hypothetical protein